MPFKSQAQRRKFAEMVKTGEISQSTFDEWNKSTGKKKLPERVSSAKVGKVKTLSDIKTLAAKRRK